MLPQYRVDVLGHEKPRWTTIELPFGSKAEAYVYERGLYSRWLTADKMRVVPVTHPRNEEYEPGSEDYDGF